MKSGKSIFEYRNYKRYLLDWLAIQPGNGHGWRSRIAKSVGCHAAYVSQVLNRDVHFSPEQAEDMNRLLGHSKDESQFFLLMVQQGRAGTSALKARINEQVEAILEKRMVLKERVDIKRALSKNDQATYYSAWYFAAVHILLTIPKFHSRDAISEALDLSQERVSEVLEFLVSTGLAVNDSGRYKVGVARIFLGNDSPFLVRHHSNWRIKAIQQIDHKEKKNLHFSTVVSLSKADFLQLREQLWDAIEGARRVIKESKEEELCCLNLDFFSVMNSRRL
jgi:uncharacterized protein (TIGR02147 family)